MFDAQGQMDQLPLLYVLSNDYANDGVYDMGEKKNVKDYSLIWMFKKRVKSSTSMSSW